MACTSTVRLDAEALMQRAQHVLIALGAACRASIQHRESARADPIYGSAYRMRRGASGKEERFVSVIHGRVAEVLSGQTR